MVICYSSPGKPGKSTIDQVPQETDSKRDLHTDILLESALRNDAWKVVREVGLRRGGC